MKKSLFTGIIAFVVIAIVSIPSFAANPTPVLLVNFGGTADVTVTSTDDSTKSDTWKSLSQNGIANGSTTTLTVEPYTVSAYFTGGGKMWAGKWGDTGDTTYTFATGQFLTPDATTSYATILEEMKNTLGLNAEVPESVYRSSDYSGQNGDRTSEITVSGLTSGTCYTLYVMTGVSNTDRTPEFELVTYDSDTATPVINYAVHSSTSYSKGTTSITSGTETYDMLVVRVHNLYPTDGTIKFKAVENRTGFNVLALAETDYVEPAAVITRELESESEIWSTASEWTDEVVPSETSSVELKVISETGSTLTLDADASVDELAISGSYAVKFAGEESLTASATAVNTDVDVSGITASLGAVTIAEGKKLTIGANTQITSISGEGTLVLDGAAISISADVSTPIEIGEGGGTITATSGHIALTGLISGSGSLALNGGAGSLAVKNSANTYSGALTIASGVVYVGNYGNQNSGTASTLPASTITVKSGATLVSHITGTYSWTSDIVLEDGATLGVKDATANQLTFAGNLAVNGNATFYFHWRKDANFTGVVSGSGTLTILENNAEGGTSTMTLGNTQNTFTGVYKTSERQVGNTSCNVKIIVAEGAAANAGFDLNASDDVVQFNAASDTVASVNGTAGTVSSGNESGTVLTVTGTADFSDITLQDVTVGLVETSVVTLTQSQALANGTTAIPAGATVNVVLGSLNSSCALSDFTVSEGATFNFIDPETDEVVTSGASGTTYTPPLPVWSPVDAESVFGDEECWADKAVPISGSVVINTSTWGENISVTIPAGFTSVTIEANTTKYTKILMADGASIPSITASGMVAFTPAILNSANTDIGKVTTLVVDTAHADAITRDLAKEIITIGTGTAEISGVISGSGALTVSSGSTLKLTAANTRTGGVIVETGATLDISSENARLFDDSWGDWSKTVAIKVSGTLISRSWSYGVNGALGCLAANSFCVELDGGAVHFVESVESSDARGFTVTENGGQISIADGLTFYHDRPNDENFGIANGDGGTLTLSGAGVYKFNGYVAGVVSVASGTTLAVVADSEGTPVTSFTSLALVAGSIVDVSAAELSAVGLSLPETGVVKIALGEKPVVGKKIVTSYSLMSSFDEDKFDVGKYTLDFVPEDMTVYLGPRQCFYIIVR